MTLRSNVDSTVNNVIPTRYNKFWRKPIMDEDSSSNNNTSSAADNLTTFEGLDDDQPLEKTTNTKRYQTKMLLASLLEHFCRAYGDTPDANRKVFFLICQTLRSLGIIDAEFVDEMTNVRSAFQQAFHKLFFTAVQTVRNQDLVHFDDHPSAMLNKKKEEDSSSSSSSSSSSDQGDDTPEPSSSTTTTSSSSSEDIMEYFSAQQPALSSSKLSTSTSAIMGNNGDDFFYYNLSVQNSRYNNDFVEIGLIGKGGFASAFRARNKLDGIYYAIKKIRLGNDIEDQDHPYEKIFREIKNLARLEHHNVIRYYSSWLEFDNESNGDEISTDGSDWEEDTSRPYSGRHSPNDNDDESSVFRGVDPTFSTSSLEIDRGDDMSHIQFGECSTSGYVAGSNDDDSPSPWPTATTKKKNVIPQKKPSNSGWTLFIQMQLCPTTLHDYIRFRNKQYAEELSFDIVDTQRNIQLFTQILEGTAYIHDQGLIHRDLKPSNIFLSMPTTSGQGGVDSKGRRRRRRMSSAGLESNSRHHYSGSYSSTTHSSLSPPESPQFLFENSSSLLWEEPWVPKIGDFGLAAEVMEDENEEGVLIPTPISSSPSSPRVGPLSTSTNTNKRPQFRRTRTVGVGTRTYASPEQLAIPAQAYDEKVDIYSLGIILFELFQPFATGMERADSIDKLKRNGVFPPGFLELYPKVSALILWMMDKNPRQRPTAHQLLAFELFATSPTQQQDDLYLKTQLQSKINLLERKNKEIDELKERVKQVELEKQLAIEDMQRQLDAMKLQLSQYEQSCLMKRKKEVRWL